MITAWLGNIWIKGILIALIAGGIGGTWIYIGKLRAERDAARLEVAAAQADLARLSAANQANLRALDRLEMERVLALRRLESSAAEISRLQNTLGLALGGIADAPETHDGPVAPLFLDAARRVRQHQQDRAAAGDGDP